MGKILYFTYRINLTSPNYVRLREETKRVVESSKGQTFEEIVIDLKNTNFIDSSGIGLIVSLIKRFHKKKIRIINCSSIQYTTFKISQLNKIIEVEDPHKKIEKTSLTKVSKSEKFFIIQLLENITYENVQFFKNELVEAFSQQSRKAEQWDEFIFNFQHITDIDSAGIGTILGIYRRVKQIQKVFKIIGCDAHVYQLLSQMDLTKLFEIEKDN